MTHSNRPEDPLLPRIADGDALAVQSCLDRYSPLVYSLVRKALRDADAVEDVVQEVFIELWQKAGRYDPERASEATFIATVARRRAIDRGRRARSGPEIEDVEGIEGSAISAPDSALEQVELLDEARRARAVLDRLPEQQRRVIVMSVVEGLTHQEIAATAGIPLGTVKSHIRRGLLRAAEELNSAPGEALS